MLLGTTVGTNSHSPATEPEKVQVLSTVKSQEPIGKEGHVKAQTLTPRAYGKIKTDSEKPKIPRQIREIQENLTFEKIRRTGTKNNAR